ncbi:MAG: hypothetical protein Q7S82_02885 [bacterium]|nr:hypothetical protein [bacterium]
MSLEVKKQERETSQSLIRRFTQRIQRSRVLARARKNRYHKRPKSHAMKKRSALRREKLKEEYKKLDKMGQKKS